MKRTLGLMAAIGVLLLALGWLLSWQASRGFTEKQYAVSAGGCPMELTEVVKTDFTPSNSDAVVLIHGLAANRKIMENLARTFANLGVRVFVPDLPGHGRSQGPFTTQHAEECSLSLVRGMAARGLIDPAHTLLVGHSLGGAIVLRIAPKFRPAGVIAISPAPMVAAHGVGPENVLYPNPPPLQANTLILASQFEPLGLAANAQDLAATRKDGTVRFVRIPWQSHVGMLFSKAVEHECQSWAAHVFGKTQPESLPSEANLPGSFLGLLGIFLLAIPFIYEMVGKEARLEKPASDLPSPLRLSLEIVGFSVLLVLLLKHWVPLRFVGLFEGDYLASFFLLLGALLLAVHWKLALRSVRGEAGVVLGASVAALVLHLLITGWLQLTITGSWMNGQRWQRFPIVCLAILVFFYALELVLGPAEEPHATRRVVPAVAYVFLAWVVLAFGAFELHSGQVLLVLLIPFFAAFLILLRMAAQLVRRLSASPLAAALFGAILLAGLCLVLFPVS